MKAVPGTSWHVCALQYGLNKSLLDTLKQLSEGGPEKKTDRCLTRNMTWIQGLSKQEATGWKWCWSTWGTGAGTSWLRTPAPPPAPSPPPPPPLQNSTGDGCTDECLKKCINRTQCSQVITCVPSWGKRGPFQYSFRAPPPHAPYVALGIQIMSQAWDINWPAWCFHLFLPCVFRL